MIRDVLSALTALSLTLAANTARADGPVVVELYTSQGCSSCPPADELLAQLADRDDVIALGLHVDYWDYIGWADTFADHQFTLRQQSYARVAGAGMVYTPQMIIGGADHVVGNRPMEVADTISAHRGLSYPVAINISHEGGIYTIEARTEMAPPRPDMLVQLVRFMPHSEVEIARGENAGRNAEYHNIVRSWQVIGEWDGGRPFVGRVQPQDDLPLAVIVQAAGPGRILGAMRLPRED